jgi:RNA polymerase sigma-70 factor (ECF subfamily)
MMPNLERSPGRQRHRVQAIRSVADGGSYVDRALVEAAQRGEHDAFEALAIGSADRLFAIARLILRDTHLAEDAVQDTLVHAWRDLPRLRDPERFDAWLRRLLINACADQGRHRRRRAAEIQIIRAEPSAEDATGSMADRDQLERGFRRLKPDQRAVVVLHFYLGLTTSEVADTLGIPVGTAKSRLHYATETLRAALEADARVPVATTNGRPA